MSDVFPITIYHNPACGTSRNTLAIIEAAGYTPTVVEYLKTGWTRNQLKSLFAAMGIKPRDAMREKGTPAADLGLLDPSVSDDQILDAMVAHPVLVNRPIVVTPKGASQNPGLHPPPVQQRNDIGFATFRGRLYAT
jgi:arsenate reductase